MKPPKILAKHSHKDPEHVDQGGIKPGILAIDSNDEKVNKVTGVLEFINHLSNDFSIIICSRIIKAHRIYDAEKCFFEWSHFVLLGLEISTTWIGDSFRMELDLPVLYVLPEFPLFGSSKEGLSKSGSRGATFRCG